MSIENLFFDVTIKFEIAGNAKEHVIGEGVQTIES